MDDNGTKRAFRVTEPSGERRTIQATASQHFIRERLRRPGDFKPGSFRTLEEGTHRVIVGHLKRSRSKETVAQSIFHPRSEGRPCPTCESHRMNSGRGR